MDVFNQLCIVENSQNLRIDTRKMGLIVSGNALTKIFGTEKIMKKFISLSQKAEVVLACRVSPKQKAEIV
jgi:magnesium-transporting ATPase (P-type)